MPLKRQFEQTHNAHFLRQSGLGEYSENPSREDLARFLGSLDTYRGRLERHRIDPAEQEQTLLVLLEQVRPGRRAVA